MESTSVSRKPSRLRATFAILALVFAVSVTLTRAQSAQPAPSAMEQLQSSLTEAQRQAIAAALASHEGALGSMAQQISAAIPGTAGAGDLLYLPMVVTESGSSAIVSGEQGDDTAGLSATRPDGAGISPALDAVNASLQQIQADFEADLAGILSAEQMGLYRAALANATASAEVTATTQQSGVDPLVCFNAAQWANYAFAYEVSAKAFAIMAAFNVDYGTETPKAVQAYISFNEATSYSLDGLQNLSTASVLLTAADVRVKNINGGTLFGVKGDADIKLADARNALATSLALSDYRDSGGVVVRNTGVGGNYFSFFAYAYGAIANFYLDGSLARTPACY